MAIYFDNFLNMLICIFQFYLSSINKPTHLILLLHSIGILLMVRFNLIYGSEFIILNRISLDFFIFTDNLFIHSHSYNRYRYILCRNFPA